MFSTEYAKLEIERYGYLYTVHSGGGQNPMLGVFLNHSRPHLLVTVSLTEPEPCRVGKIGWPESCKGSSCLYISSTRITSKWHTQVFDVGAWD